MAEGCSKMTLGTQRLRRTSIRKTGYLEGWRGVTSIWRADSPSAEAGS